MIKAGAQRLAAELGLLLVAPDTSPRQPRLPGDDASWDFGLGAGFYVDATEAPWSAHYRMYSYVTRELPELIAAHFPADTARSGIFGHSMGGHGALVCALRNPAQYRSLSAFAPIAAPMQCPWGRKAFTGYLGVDESRLARLRLERVGRATAVPLADPRGPGHGRQIPRRATEPRSVRGRLPALGPALRATHARGLRPRLLVHPDLHGGSHAVACAAARAFKRGVIRHPGRPRSRQPRARRRRSAHPRDASPASRSCQPAEHCSSTVRSSPA